MKTVLLVLLYATFAAASSVDASVKSLLTRELLESKKSLMRTASLLDENEDEEESARMGWGGRRRRWHAHWPHGHAPHGHHPHAHVPHVHWPHAHVPHVHVPWEAAEELAEKLGNELVDEITKFAKPAFDAMEDAAGDIGDSAKELWSDIKNVAGSATNELVSWGKRVVEEAPQVFEDTIIAEANKLGAYFEQWAKDAGGNTMGDVHYLCGLNLPSWSNYGCPSSKTCAVNLPVGFPTINIDTSAISAAVANLFIGMYNVVFNKHEAYISANDTKWNQRGSVCGTDRSSNWAVAFMWGVEGELSAGVGVAISASLNAAHGVGIGCDNGYIKAGLLAGVGMGFGVSAGASVKGGPGAGVTYEIQVFLPSFHGTATGKAWGNMPGHAMGFGAGLGAEIIGSVAAGITVYTSMPSWDFGCRYKDYCENHARVCVPGTSACLSTNEFCPVIKPATMTDKFSCDSQKICATNVPYDFYSNDFSWEFYAIAASATVGAAAAVSLEASVEVSLGITGLIMDFTPNAVINCQHKTGNQACIGN